MSRAGYIACDMEESKLKRGFASTEYWEGRYSEGGNSGKGSYGELAQYKADVLNEFVREHQIERVIELGSGDGNQTALFRFDRYLGFDVSRTAIEQCRQRFARRSGFEFQHVSAVGDAVARTDPAPLCISLDVVFHLVEDAVFEYLGALFALSSRFAVVYSSNFDRPPQPKSRHVRHRYFVDEVSRAHGDWKLVNVLAKHRPLRGRPYNFYIFEKTGAPMTFQAHAGGFGCLDRAAS